MALVRYHRGIGAGQELHLPLDLSLRSKVSLSTGGSEPGVSVPLRSMSDPDQDFDREVRVTQHRPPWPHRASRAESTHHLWPQGQLVRTGTRKTPYSRECSLEPLWSPALQDTMA